MTEDDVVVLDLRADGPAGETGDARLSIGPRDPMRQEIESHLRAEMTELRAGRRVLVRPFR